MERAKATSHSISNAFARHVLLPIILGSVVYPVRWAVWRGGPDELLSAFEASASLLLGVAPDGLWAYALVSSVCLVWNNQHTRASVLWTLVAAVTAIGHELCQAAGQLPGTFDFLDLLATLVGCGLAIHLHHGSLR